MNKTSIVFFGSGPVAAESLKLLVKDFSIEAVITKPKPAHHKGDFPVLSLAKELKLMIHTVQTKVELSELISRQGFQSQAGILVDFGIIVAQEVIDAFPLGIVNSHFSILPEWRGADPITFAILSGQKQTGVSIMLLVEALDEGPLLGYGEYDLPPGITTPLLTDHLTNFSYALLKELVPLYLTNSNFQPVPQEVTGREVSYSRKLTKEDGLIDWHKSAEQLEREVRAYIEWPKSRTMLAGKEVIITKASLEARDQVADGNHIGKTLILENKRLGVQTGDGILVIEKLKPASKKEMTAQEFLTGYSHLL